MDGEKEGQPIMAETPAKLNVEAPPEYDKDPPPTYNRVMGKITGIKESSSDNKQFAQNMCALIFCNTITTIIGIICSIAIPIAHITIGALYLDDCPKERMIPIYLLVCGCFMLLKAFFSIAQMIHKKRTGQSDEEYERPKAFQCCDAPIGCFLLAWFIAGNVWIFRAYDHGSDASKSDYCNSTLYLYAFWMLIVGYIITAAIILLCCVVGCVACCCAASKQESQ